jgi:NADH-quinone oxidoreductase subunit N
MNALMPFAPVLTISLGSLGYLLGGKFLERTKLTGLFACLLVGLALYLLAGLGDSSATIEHGLIVNSFSRLLAIVACAGALVSIVGCASSLQGEEIDMTSEYYFLTLTSLCGALLMILASDFLTLFIGLEVASLALYCLCGARIKRRSSSESALKYFLMGSFSSAFFLYGIALWYGATGTLLLEPESRVVVSSSPLLMLSFLMMVIGMAFKLGLAPFHFWVPDVYQGAPTSVTSFMSAVIKIAAIGALVRVSIESFVIATPWSTGVLWLFATLAMCVGNFAALQQQSVKRMLAYSSVAQVGYMLMGLVVFDGTPDAVAATIYYLISYTAMTVGAFLVLLAIGPNTDELRDLKGLGARSPFLATCVTLIFLALAGLPPGLAGLVGKVYLFAVTLSQEFYGLAIIAALNSALSCAYYLRVPAVALFQAADSSEPLRVSLSMQAALVVCAGAVVVLGVYPQLVLDLVASAGRVMAVR